MLELLLPIARVHLAGPLTLGMLGCSLLVAVALLVAASVSGREAGRRLLRGLLAAEAACLSAALALVVALVTAARRRMLSAATQEDVPPFRTHLAELVGAFEQIHSALLLAGGALVAVALLLICAGAQWHLRGATDPRRAGARGILLQALFALMLGVMGLGVARYGNAGSLWFELRAGPLHEEVPTTIARQDAPLGEARLVILVVAILGTAGLAYLAASARGHPARRLGPGAGVGSVVLFGVGLAAYGAIRPLSADARQPVMPHRGGDFECPGVSFDARALPPAARCEALVDAPMLEITARGTMLDGMLTTAAGIVTVLEAKRRLFVSLHGASRPLPPLIVLADANTRVRDVAPHLAGIMGAFGPEVMIATVRPAETLSTRTLGEIPRTARCCGVSARLDPGGAPSSEYGTWGDLARAAAEASPPPLVIAP